ncbi:MAG: extracellular solute-binding protein [Candidatus Paceibacterota bacterium]
MKISKFQLITLAIFVICIIAGVIAFATFKNSSSKDTIPPITVWGTFPKATFEQYVSRVNSTLALPITAAYTQKSTDAFLSDFVSALARGSGPDAVLIPADMILPAQDKLAPIPYSVIPQRTFLNSYIDESGVYLSADGVLAVPFITDPLVMFWNRDLYNAAGIALPPKSWDEFTGLNQKLTVKDQNGTITRSAVAMGDFSNITNAREILATLFLQSGNPITAIASDGALSSTINNSAKADPTAAIQFFTRFVDPTDTNYSWNRSWPNAKTAFVSGKLATYFGLASELSDIRAKNPNLNFDVAAVPQAKQGSVKTVYARLYGLSIVKASNNINAAYAVISILTDPTNLVEVSKLAYLPSVSRPVIAAGFEDPYITLFNQAALISRTWLDAGPTQSSQLFAEMIQSVTSGKKAPYQAIRDAGSQYDVLLRQAVGQ